MDNHKIKLVCQQHNSKIKYLNHNDQAEQTLLCNICIIENQQDIDELLSVQQCQDNLLDTPIFNWPPKIRKDLYENYKNLMKIDTKSSVLKNINSYFTSFKDEILNILSNLQQKIIFEIESFDFKQNELKDTYNQQSKRQDLFQILTNKGQNGLDDIILSFFKDMNQNAELINKQLEDQYQAYKNQEDQFSFTYAESIKQTILQLASSIQFNFSEDSEIIQKKTKIYKRKNEGEIFSQTIENESQNQELITKRQSSESIIQKQESLFKKEIQKINDIQIESMIQFLFTFNQETQKIFREKREVQNKFNKDKEEINKLQKLNLLKVKQLNLDNYSKHKENIQDQIILNDDKIKSMTKNLQTFPDNKVSNHYLKINQIFELATIVFSVKEELFGPLKQKFKKVLNIYKRSLIYQFVPSSIADSQKFTIIKDPHNKTIVNSNSKNGIVYTDFILNNKKKYIVVFRFNQHFSSMHQVILGLINEQNVQKDNGLISSNASISNNQTYGIEAKNNSLDKCLEIQLRICIEENTLAFYDNSNILNYYRKNPIDQSKFKLDQNSQWRIAIQSGTYKHTIKVPIFIEVSEFPLTIHL